MILAGALLRACHTLFNNMPDEHRAAWRAIYDHYVFAPDEASFDHLPPELRSAPEPGPEAIAQLKNAIARPVHAVLNAALLRGELGWGGRIRTCECRYQKPVP
ncbi:MAG: hypothetical protein V4513_09435, partial [Pseudomonadota bacterium]